MATIVIEVEGGWVESHSLKWLVQDIESQTNGKVTKIIRKEDTTFDITELKHDWWENGEGDE